MSDVLDDSNDSVRGVTTAELQRRSVRAELAEGMHTMIPASVQTYDASKQMVSVQVLVKDFYRDESAALVVASVPIINNVPVQFLTAGGFTFTVPIVAGTTGSLIFSERSLDAWLSSSGAEVDPGLYGRFAIGDAIFMPGLLPFGAPMSVAPPTDHATAGSVTGARIHFRDSTICVGDESGSDFLAKATPTDANFDALFSVLSDVFGNASTPLVTPPMGSPDPVYTAVKLALTHYILLGNLPPAATGTDQAKGH